MTARVCLGCQVPEQRGVDANGRETVNLNPLTDLCIECTVIVTKEQGPYQAPALPFDARAAAAGKDAE
jgi:hypothetical protein